MKLSVITAPALAAALAFAGCGTKQLDVEDAEGKISAEIEGQTGTAPEEVRCPDEVEVEEGRTFRCTLVAEDGAEIGMTVELTDDEGGFRFEVDEEVSEPAPDG